MTCKLLLTAAIVALALTPAVFTVADSGAAFTAASGATFTAGMVASTRAITDMAISRTATTVTDRLQLAP